MFTRLPHWARAGGRRTVRLSRRQGSLIALAALMAVSCLLVACTVSASGPGTGVEGTARPLSSVAQSATTRLADAGSTALAAATATTEPTTQATPTALATSTPRPTVTPQPTATPQSTATPQATATPNTSGVIIFPGSTNSDAGFAILSVVVLLLCFAVIGLIVWLVARNSAAKHAAAQAQQQGATPAAMAGPGMTPGMTPGQTPPPGTQSEWEQTERYRTETPGTPPPYQGGQPPYQGGQPYQQGGQPPYQQGGQPPYQGGQPYQGEQPPEQPNQYQQRDEY